MGLRGEEHVRKHFLLPELVRRHLVLLRYYCGIDRVSPEFRLNGCTHREALGVFLSKYPHAIEKKDPYTP